MACNLACQLELPAALDFLDRAQGVRRGCSRRGRSAEGLAKTTLYHICQRRRVVERVAEMTARLGGLAREQSGTLEAPGRLAAAVHDVAMRALAVMQPVLQWMVEPWHERRRQAIERQQECSQAAAHEREHIASLSCGPSLWMWPVRNGPGIVRLKLELSHANDARAQSVTG